MWCLIDRSDFRFHDGKKSIFFQNGGKKNKYILITFNQISKHDLTEHKGSRKLALLHLYISTIVIL